MPTALPAIGRGFDVSVASTSVPADLGESSAEKRIPDERLGLSGFYPQGAALRRSTLTAPGAALTSTSTSSGGAAAAAAGAAGPSSVRYGPSFSRLSPAMAALDTALREALAEQMQRNTYALQAARGSMPGSGTLTRSELPGYTMPISLAAATPTPAPTGALFAASTRQQAIAGEVGPSSPATASPAAPSRPLSAGLRPTSAGANSLSRSSPLLGPRWGATEGGRDAMGWVRNLVRYTELHPLAITAGGEAAAAGADARSPDVSPDPAGPGFRRTVFPSVKPDRREDAALLGKWLEDMVSALSAHDAGRLAAAVSAGVGAGVGAPPPSSPAAQPSTATGGATSAAAAATAGDTSGHAAHVSTGAAPATTLELADGVLHVYGVAMEELRRQVGAECRERGELMAVLWDHTASAVAARASLEAEARLGMMQAEYMALLAARDTLAEDVGLLERAAYEADGEAKAAASSAAYTNRSLAGKLAAAQARAEEVAGAWRVSDMALANEVERRLGVEAELSSTTELLRRADAERLSFRASVTILEDTNAALTATLEGVRKELAAEAAAREAGRREFEALAAARASQEVDMMRVRHDYETDEILVVALRQQVRDLESQLAQLKAFQRDQALALSREVGEKEAAQNVVGSLTGELEQERGRSAELEATLADTQGQLAQTAAALAAKTLEYEELSAQRERELEAARVEIEGLNAEVRQLTSRLTDTDAKLEKKEKALKDAELELYSLREMLSSIASAMHSQGADGVPKPDDKGWSVAGPLGAAQRTLMIANRQMGNLWERLEALRRENETLTERLAGEMVMQQKLQTELYEARSEEARLIQARAETEMRLDVANQAKRVIEAENARYQELLKEANERIARGEELNAKARAEIERLTPFEPRAKELGHQVEDLTDELKLARDAMHAAKQDATALAAQNAAYVVELDKMLAQNNEMLERVRQLTVVQMEYEELKLVRATLATSVADLSAQLEQALTAHAETLHQLEIARFFLQGLDLVPPQSPMSSTASMPMHGRPQSAASTSSLPPELWRPGTAPAHFPARAARPPSARPRSSTSPLRPGTAGGAGWDGDVQFLNVSALALVEEDEELDGHGARSGLPSAGRTRLGPPCASASSGLMVAPGLMGSAAARDLLHNSGSLSRSGSLGNMAQGQTAASMLAQVMGGMQRASQTDGVADIRPLSAVSQMSGVSDVYGEEVPSEVAAMLQARGVSDRLHASQTKWLRFKIQLLAFFSNRLRAKLLEEREKSAALALQLARVEEDALKDAVAREVFIVEELMSGLRGQLDRMRHDTLTEVGGLRDMLPSMAKDLGALAATSTTMGVGLRDLQARLAARSGVGTQTGEPLSSNWAAFMQRLPMELPFQPLGGAALGEAIVRIYARALDAGGDPSAAGPAWGAPRVDTVYDAIMDHYTHQRAPGTFLPELLRDVEGPVGRLLRCARTNADGSTRVATFANLTGVSPDGTAWAPATWHFLLHLLHGLRSLLSGTWRTTLKAWASSPAGAPLPIQAVYDLVGNLYNVQSPNDLAGMVARRLAAIVTPGSAGPVVDLDALLLLLLSEHNAGSCPRAPLLFPRRLTDGALFNIFNALGHSPHTAALSDGRATVVISTSPPGSPTRKRAQVTAARRASAVCSPSGSTAASPASTGMLQASAARPVQGPVPTSDTLSGTGERWQVAEGPLPRTPSRPGTALVPGGPRNTSSPQDILPHLATARLAATSSHLDSARAWQLVAAQQCKLQRARVQ